MQGLNKELLGSMMGSMMGSLDGQDMNQVNSFWKMLDDMSENDPKAYKKFIGETMEQGFSDLKAETQEKLKSRTISAEAGLVLKFSILKINEKKKDTEIKLFDSDEPTASLDNVRLYLNICHHERILGPLGKDNSKLPVDADSVLWGKIPMSFSE